MPGRPPLVTRFVLSVVLLAALLAALPTALTTFTAAAGPPGRPEPTWDLVIPPDAVAEAASKAGYLPGSATVTPAGAFDYTIPLDVPAGRAGMAPSLSLAYSSTSGDGPVGLGWSLSGASSAITRCPRQLVPDGTRGGVRFDEDDRFCLDGQRLVVVDGDYGAPGSEYRTESASFARIVAGPADATGPDRFVVWTKAGRKLTYEARSAWRRTGESVSLTRTTTAPTQGAQPVCYPMGSEPDLCFTPMDHRGKPQPMGHAGEDEVLPKALWVLTTEADRSGNELRYTYDPGFAANNEYLVTRIDYTYGPDRAAARAVVLGYEPRPDSTFSYVAGVRFAVSQRLTSISMLAPNPVRTEAVRVYRLSYLPHGSGAGKSMRSMMWQVQACGALGGCLPAKQFTWDQGAPEFAESSLGALPLDLGASPQLSPHVKVQDLDGDGTDDILYSTGGHQAPVSARLGTRSTTTSASPLAKQRAVSGAGPAGQQPAWPAATVIDGGADLPGSRPADLDGDGRPEFLIRLPHTSDPGSTDRVARWDATKGWFVDSGLRFEAGMWSDLADVNGDGLLDRVAGMPKYSPGDGDEGPTVDWTEPRVAVQLNQGGELRPDMFTEPVTSDIEVKCARRVADVDGDGRGDLLMGMAGMSDRCGYGSPTTAVSFDDTGTATGIDGIGTGATDDHDAGRRLPPVDVQRDRFQEPAGCHVFGWPPANICSVLDTHVNGMHGWASVLADLNGDRLRDTLLVPTTPTATGWDRHGLVLWSTGTGLRWDGTVLELQHDELADLRVADMNNDGREDIVSFHNSGLAVSPGPDFTAGTQDDLVLNGPAAQDRVTVHLSLGNGTFAVHPLAISAGLPQFRPGAGRTFSHVGDFDADGYADIMRNDGQLRVSTRTAPKPDRITAVRDEGAGWSREKVTYSTQWSDHLPGKGGSASPATTFPLAPVRGGLLVVRDVISRAGAATASDPGVSTVYSYDDPVAHVRRGFVGFGTVRVWAPDRPSETVSTYDVRRAVGEDHFPFATRPTSVVTSTPVLTLDQVWQHPASAVTRTTRVEHRYESRQLNGGAVFAVFPSTTTTTEWDQPAIIVWGPIGTGTPRHVNAFGQAPPPSRTTTATQTFDDHGNETGTSRATAGGVSETTVTHYDLSQTRLDDWLTGLADWRTVRRAEADGDPVAVTRRTDNVHDERGRLRTVHVEKGNPDPSVRSSTAYDVDALGVTRAVTVSAPGLPDQVTHTEYDPMFHDTSGAQPDEDIHPSQVWSDHTAMVAGQPDSTNHRPSSWQAVHPALGVTVAAWDVNGRATYTHVDDLGRTIRTTGTETVTIRTRYLPHTVAVGMAGVRTETTIDTGAKGAQAATVFADGLGRTIRTTALGFDGGLITTRTGYDALGRIATTTRPFVGATAGSGESFTYDSLDRPLVHTLPDGSTETRSYPSFLVTGTVDPRGTRTETTVDVDGRPTSTTTQLDTAAPGAPPNLRPVTTRHTYAPFDLPHTVTDANGNVTTHRYDVAGRRIRLEDPDRGTSTAGYYGTGLVSGQSHLGSGESSTHTYDDLGRVVTRLDTVGGDTATTGFVWDTAANGIGQLASATGQDGITTRYRYDGLGRRVGTDHHDAATGVTYRTDTRYDAVGRIETVTYPDMGGWRPVLRTSYNAYNFAERVTEVTPGRPEQVLWRTRARNADLALTSASLGTTGPLNSPAVDLGRGYHPVTGRLETVTAKRPAGTQPLHAVSYTYLADGMVRTRSQNDAGAVRTETYGYDDLDRVTGWDLTNGSSPTTSTGYGYDLIGNLTTVTRDGVMVEERDHNGPRPHAVTSSDNSVGGGGLESYGYDAEGRQTTVDSEGTRFRHTSFTALDLPRTVTDANGDTTDFSYDAFGARVKEAGPDGTTFTVPGLFERRTAGHRDVRVAYLGGPDGVFGQLVADGLTTRIEYSLTDALGSTGAVADRNGTLTASMFYEPYGARITPDGARDTRPDAGTAVTHGFTGHEHDDELRLIDMKGRAYDPVAKTFLSPDPVLDNHPYSYVDSSPASHTDPTGRDGDCFACNDGWDRGHDSQGNFTGQTNIGGYTDYSQPTYDTGNAGSDAGRYAHPLEFYPGSSTAVHHVAGLADMSYRLGQWMDTTFSATRIEGENVFEPYGTYQQTEFRTTNGDVVEYAVEATAVLYPLVSAGLEAEAVVAREALFADASAAPMSVFTDTELLRAELESGSTIYHGKNFTAIGDDAATQANMVRAVRGEGRHVLIVHGQVGEFVVDGVATHPQQVADAMLSNPNYTPGVTVDVCSCHGGDWQTLQEIIGSSVNHVWPGQLADLDPATGLLRAIDPVTHSPIR